MDELIRLLHEGGYSCVIRKEEIRTFTQRGVADLYDLLNQHPVFLHGAQVADKVVGKAAAALMVLGGVREVYTDISGSCLVSNVLMMLYVRRVNVLHIILTNVVCQMVFFET